MSDEPKVIDLMQALKTSLRVLRPDEPCAHPGCLSHVSHPCEGCGRIAGRYVGDMEITEAEFKRLFGAADTGDER